MTARLVATGALPQAGPPWSTVLQSCGAQQAYLRTNRGLIRDDRVAAFLVLDRAVPALGPLRAVRRRAPARGDRPGDRSGWAFPTRPAAGSGRIRTSLEYRPVPDVMADLPAQMRRVAGRRHRRVRRRRPPYFPAGPATTWVEEYA